MRRSSETNIQSGGIIADHLLESNNRSEVLYSLKRTFGAAAYQQVAELLVERNLEINEPDVEGTLEEVRKARPRRRISKRFH